VGEKVSEPVFYYGVAWYPEWEPEGEWKRDLERFPEPGVPRQLEVVVREKGAGPLLLALNANSAHVEPAIRLRAAAGNALEIRAARGLLPRSRPTVASDSTIRLALEPYQLEVVELET
jgi:hypothetical protein